MPSEYAVLVVFGLILLLAGYILGRHSASLDTRKEYYTHPKTKPRLIPKWLFFQSTPDWRAGFWQGLSTEMIGGIITAVLLGFVITLAQRAESERSLKQQLILQMGSSNPSGFAIEAARQLATLGWLYDGSLKGADLAGAYLVGADLAGANLAGADLAGANLVGTDIEGADLADANLAGTDLQNANLKDVILERAILSYSNLREASLRGANLLESNLYCANLQSVDFWHAYLDGVNLEDANLKDTYYLIGLSKTTILPDETMWSPDVVMARFTNPNNPDFWRPNPDEFVWWDIDDSDHPIPIGWCNNVTFTGPPD